MLPSPDQYLAMLDGAAAGRYKRAYDPRAWGAEAEIAMAERVAQACEQLGSAGRSTGA